MRRDRDFPKLVVAAFMRRRTVQGHISLLVIRSLLLTIQAWLTGLNASAKEAVSSSRADGAMICGNRMAYHEYLTD